MNSPRVAADPFEEFAFTWRGVLSGCSMTLSATPTVVHSTSRVHQVGQNAVENNLTSSSTSALALISWDRHAGPDFNLSGPATNRILILTDWNPVA